jgi:hypothetical protein
MKYAALDLETWGLFEHEPQRRGPEKVAMISIIVEDTKNRDVPVEKLPHYTMILAQDRIEGEAVALALNAWIIDAIARFINGPNRPLPLSARGPAFSSASNQWPVQWQKAGWKGAERFLLDTSQRARSRRPGRTSSASTRRSCPRRSAGDSGTARSIQRCSLQTSSTTTCRRTSRK